MASEMPLPDMPFPERKKLCSLLDEDDIFEELARVHMQYDPATVERLRQERARGRSPTDELLNLWSDHDHTVFELFILLNRMKQYRAMAAIKPLIDPKYHHLIKEAPLRELVVNSRVKSEKILNAPVATVPSREDNESVAPNKAKPKSIALTDISVVESAGSIPQIPYEHLMKSTNNWDSRYVLGRGGFGTVFKGTWKCTQVAIKRIEMKEDSPDSRYQQMMQSLTELHCLTANRHDNILPLYGYSSGGPQPCLVYQFMSGGSLKARLHPRNASRLLQWRTRLSIAIGTARGLQFLHTIRDKPLIHGDIKPDNILLDPNDVPRIGDFGLAREGPLQDYVKVSRIHGTKPYLPEEFIKYGKFSIKLDTYSFGVVLFEVATAASVISAERRPKYLRDYVLEYPGDVLELKDKRVDGGEDCFRGLGEGGKGCVRLSAKDRPDMVTVLAQLEALS